MNNQAILAKAIQKAIDGGWAPEDYMVQEHSKYWSDRANGWLDEDDFLGVETIIFNHQFAKALWGEEEVIINARDLNLYDDDEVERKGVTMPRWAYHLQNMVIAEDPIKYLGENL